MPKALAITRDDFTVEELREAAARSTDADAARRMLGLALVLDGYQRGEAANLCGMDRQILRDWVIRYNAEGVAGGFRRLSVRPRHPKQDREAQEAHKKLCRSRHRCDPRTCARKADRTLVAR
jgi:transposase